MRARVIGRDNCPHHIAQIARDGAFIDGVGDLAILNPKARGPARIIAGIWVDGGADQPSDQQAGAHAGNQVIAALRALGEGRIADGG